MNPTDRRLVREITLVIVLKLILITALWWAFIRDAKVRSTPAPWPPRLSPRQPRAQNNTRHLEKRPMVSDNSSTCRGCSSPPRRCTTSCSCR
jgi:hypothetical protein